MSELHLFVKIHEKDNLVFDGGEQVVFVDQLVNVLVPKPQVDLQGSVVTLVIRVPGEPGRPGVTQTQTN